MAFNPMNLMKIKERLTIFQRQHPKVHLFLQDVGSKAIKEGSVIEMKVTDPDGKSYVTNIRLTKEDIESIELMKTMG